MMLLLYIAAFAGGLFMLLKGAERVVNHASALAKESGVSQLAIGVTLVALSTTLPEFSVSLLSALSGAAEVATGTVVGSVIVNIGLVVGLPALIVPVRTIKAHVNEGLVMVLFTVMLSVFLYGGMHWYEGIIILAMTFFYVWVLTRRIEKVPIKAPKLKTRRKGLFRRPRHGSHIIKIIVAGIVVFAGAELLIFSTEGMAPMLGIPDYVIAFLVIAIGTSLPELATSIMALKSGNRDLSLGNIMGANIFDISTLGLVSLITQVPATAAAGISIPVMLLMSVLFVAFMRRGWRISRAEGLVLLSVYFCFVALMFAL